MPGFDNGVMYASNVDFTGTSATSGSAQVLTDGQLLIGSTAAPNIRVGTLTAGTGITITPGAGTISIAASGSALTDLHVAKLIVNSVANAGGNFTSITAAIASAVSGDTIFIMPGATGVYTENFSLPAGVNLTAFDCDALTPHVTITGKITVSGAGTSSISGIRLQTNSDFSLVVSTRTLYLKNCTLSFTNNAGISQSSGRIELLQCTGSASTGNALFTNTGGVIFFFGCKIDGSGSSTPATASDGFVTILNSKFTNPFTTTSTAAFAISTSEVNTAATNATALTIGGSGINAIENSRILSGSGASISAGNTVVISNTTINSSNTNPITGAGQVSISSVDFSSTGLGVNTSTIVPLSSYLVPSTYTTDGICYFDGSKIVTTAAGTATQVLTSNGPGVAATYQSIPGGVTIFTTTLTNAQIKTLNSVPVQLVAAPAAGSVIIPTRLILKFNYGGNNAFVTGGNLNLISAGSGLILVAVNSAIYTGTVDKVYSSTSVSNPSSPFGTLEAQAIQIKAATIDPTGNANNDNTISVWMSYETLTIT